MPTTQTKKTAMEEVTVPAFGIEADHPRNSDLLIQVIVNCRLRSAIKPTKEIFDREDGEQVVSFTESKMFDGLPSQIPGMQLHVNPQEGTYAVIVSLEGDERTLERIKHVMDRQSGVSVSSKLRAAKSSEGKLNKDQTKTLVRELYHLVTGKQAKVVKGVLPDMVDIEDLPGDFLLNSSNQFSWHQPKHEKDLEEWADKMNRLEK